MDPRDLEGFVLGERRQDPRQATREHGLARSGWSAEQQVVSACSRELQCTSCAFLATHVGKIECRGRRRSSVYRNVRLQLEIAAQIPRRVGEMADRNRLDAGERRFI